MDDEHVTQMIAQPPVQAAATEPVVVDDQDGAQDQNIDQSIDNSTILTTDNTVNTGNTETRKRKRRRRVLVCVPCHKHKQKCDRGSPCGKCVASDRVDQCVYASLPPPVNEYHADDTERTLYDLLRRQTGGYNQQDAYAGAQDSQRGSINRSGLLLAAASALERTNGTPAYVGQAPAMTYAKGKVRCSGASHWSQMIFDFEEMRPYLLARSTALSEVKRRERIVKRLFPRKKPRAFPFGDSPTQVSYDQATRLDNLPSRDVVDSLVSNYLVTIEKLFPLFYAPTLCDDLHRFWKEPATASNAWLAQLYLLLALSCLAGPKEPYNVEGGYLALTERLMDGAEMCFTQTSFMYRPDITSFIHVRTLCMIIIANQLEMIGIDGDGTWVLMGFVVRSAMVQWLHRDPDGLEAMHRDDKEMRKRIWTTVLQLDLMTAINTGRQLQCRTDDFSTPAPIASYPDREDMRQILSLDNTESRFQNDMMHAYKPLSQIITRVNSPWPGVSAQEMKDYDSQLRHLISQTEAAIQQEGPNSPSWKRLQHIMFSNILRRVRLALHQPTAVIDTDSHLSRTSHYIILECAIAILFHHNNLDEDDDTHWALELFQEDLRVAVVHVCLGLRRGLFATEPNEHDGTIAHQTAWATLNHSLQQIERTLDRSLSHLKSFLGFSVMKAVVEACEQQPNCNYLEVITKAAFEAYDVVEPRFPRGPGVAVMVSPETTTESTVMTPLENGVGATDPSVYHNTGSIDPALGGHVTNGDGDTITDLIDGLYVQK